MVALLLSTYANVSLIRKQQRQRRRTRLNYHFLLNRMKQPRNDDPAFGAPLPKQTLLERFVSLVMILTTPLILNSPESSRLVPRGYDSRATSSGAGVPPH